MKKLLFLLISLVAINLQGQIVQVDNITLQVRDKINGPIIIKKDFPGILKTAAGNGIIVMLFETNFIEVTDKRLNVISTDRLENLESIGITTDYKCPTMNSANAKPKPVIILTYKDGKIEKRNMYLKILITILNTIRGT